jgi:hypothetical protein
MFVLLKYKERLNLLFTGVAHILYQAKSTYRAQEMYQFLLRILINK